MNETEREIILNILNRLGTKIYIQDFEFIEFENNLGHEDILIDFDEDGNVVSIGC